MNFLAHLLLAERTGTSMAGAVLGDVVRGSDLSAYPEDIALGIRVHRRVDAATDRHPVMAALRSGYLQGQRRYAGIVLDIVADHVLALQWSQYTRAESLPDFADRAGLAIAEAATWFELAGGRASNAAGFAALLLSYCSDEGIDRALQRTAARMRSAEGLLAAATNWQVHVGALGLEMPRLMDDLQRSVQALLETQSG